MPSLVDMERLMTGEVIVSLLPVWLDRHVLNLLSEYLCLYFQTRSALCLDQKDFLYIRVINTRDSWLVKELSARDCGVVSLRLDIYCHCLQVLENTKMRRM